MSSHRSRWALGAQAHGTGIAHHSSGGAVCGAGAVYVNLPSDMRSWSGGMEEVRWSPDLWKCTASGWVPFNTAMPWLVSAANAYGLRGWNGSTWHLNGFGLISARVFPGLAPGWYAVAEYFKWPQANNYQHQNLSPNPNGSTYCRVS